MNNIRVRFAPSPTGALHIGGVRTALYNYLLTKRYGGSFILRIEDTDQTRYVSGAEDYIKEALEWCGLTPDEGPGYGGDFGPYRQSERKHLYKQYADQMIASGNAYYAFDTPEELAEVRQALEDQGETFIYNSQSRGQLNNSLSLSEAETQARIESGLPFTVRLKIPADEQIVIEDLIRATVTFDSNELDDKIILKGDGMPTYHLANIVDDHLMQITHVIRGEEWLPSTAHHLLMYRFMGWTAPSFAHLPLILKPAPASFITGKTTDLYADKFTEEFFKKHRDYTMKTKEEVRAFIRNILVDVASLSDRIKVKKKDKEDKIIIKSFLKDTLFGKLSKRDGDRLGFPVFPLSWNGKGAEDSFAGFRECGYDAKAVNNFMAFLGWNPGTDQEIFSLEELSAAFSLDRVSKSGARFDIGKANWFNQQYIMKAADADLAKAIRPQIEAKNWEVSPEKLARICGLYKERVQFIPDFVDKMAYLFEDISSYDEKNGKKRWNPENRPAFEQLNTIVETIAPFEESTIEEKVKAWIEESGLGFGKVLPILRIAIAGTMQGPSVFAMMEVAGKTMSIDRLNKAYDLLDRLKADA